LRLKILKKLRTARLNSEFTDSYKIRVYLNLIAGKALENLNTDFLYGMTISPEKIILQREKEHRAIFIRAHCMRGLRLGLG